MASVRALVCCTQIRNFTKLMGFRSLYSQSALGIDSYIQHQSRVKYQLTDMEDKFRNKMKENVEEGSKNIIFTEDLKNMLHIAQEDDLDLVIAMLKRFNQQNKQLRFGNFIFGPVIMRMFHILNKPKEALECFRMPELNGIFDQLISFQLLLDLLYENQMYKELLNTFELIKEKQIDGSKYSKNVVMLTLAACYKLNSKTSLEYALKLWADLMNVGHSPARRAATFCAGLVLNQGEPSTVLEILSCIKNQNYTTIRNLKVMTFLKLDRVDDALQILKSVLNQEQIHTFNKDVLEKAEEHIKGLQDTELENNFNQILKYLRAQGHISEITLDEQLCSKISLPQFNKQNAFANTYRYNVQRSVSSRSFSEKLY